MREAAGHENRGRGSGLKYIWVGCPRFLANADFCMVEVPDRETHHAYVAKMVTCRVQHMLQG
jgi:hypothetical protein